VVSIELLNHASVAISCPEVALVTDPWFSGVAFSGAWGLKHWNPGAMDRAASCSHLWVSHPHGDHMHSDTLRELASVNPSIQVLANSSWNFDLQARFRSLGFHCVCPFRERSWRSLAACTRLIRYAVGGMDNLMVIESHGLRILNYNDCYLPPSGVRALMRRIGPVDVLLVSFNHSFKLLLAEADETVKAGLKHRLARVIELVQPRFVVPFASGHYYRSPYSLHQNRSLMEVSELLDVAPQILEVGTGDIIRLAADRPSATIGSSAVFPHQPDVLGGRSPAKLEPLTLAMRSYLARIRRKLNVLRWRLRPITIRVDDLGVAMTLDIRRGVKITDSCLEDACMRASSATLAACFSDPFGTDELVTGADFGCNPLHVSTLSRWILAGLRIDNRLSPGDLASAVTSRSGRRFLLNRREEWLSFVCRQS
jgi:L-ascorbate metabolism protein UlaG (beta-lactamase superfamily)